MSKRPDVRMALDLRSDETVMVIADPERDSFRYEPEWQRPLTFEEVYVDNKTVVIVDRMELSRESIASITAANPRLLAIAVMDPEHEKRTRKALRTLHPWSDVWDITTEFGRLIVTSAFGPAYDRANVIDMRAQASA